MDSPSGSELMPARIKNIIGQRFGRLQVIATAGRDKNSSAVWRCLCDCGEFKKIAGASLRSGYTKSCGCLSTETRLQSIHGHARRTGETPEYRSYYAARTRCRNAKGKFYKDYGGRGIKFLFNSFEQWFAELGPKPEPKHLYSVDRYPNNDGHYEKAT